MQQVKRNIAFFTILVWAALAGGTLYFATSQTKYCFFDIFSFLVKVIKNSCFATSQTKYCFFYSSFPVCFSFLFVFGPLIVFVFCNTSNGILRFYDFTKKYHFSWKSLLFDANFSIFTFCFKTCIILHIIFLFLRFALKQLTFWCSLLYHKNQLNFNTFFINVLKPIVFQWFWPLEFWITHFLIFDDPHLLIILKPTVF